MATPQAQKKQPKPKPTGSSTSQSNNKPTNNGQAFSERDIKQNSGVSASMALQAMQKAWDLRQAANAAGDPDAREEILAKSINKEIEAESFGKAAKYTQSGTFQGLAAGAGLGVMPGVTLGKITGAIVGGLVSTVTGLLGGGIGAVYGAMSGPMWDLGQMASHGVRGVIGDFPNWKSTPAQKRALEKMVMQTKDTQAPTKEELEKMKAEAPDDVPQSWSQSAKDMTSWRPSMPSMPAMPNMPSMSQAGAAMGLGGLGASLPSWGGKTPTTQQTQTPSNTKEKSQSATTSKQTVRPKPSNARSSEQATQKPKLASKPQEPPRPKEAPSINDSEGKNVNKRSISSTAATETTPQIKPVSKPQKHETNTAPKQTANGSAKTSGPTPVERRKPKKLERRGTGT